MNDHVINKDTLVEQYKTMIELYKHEDSLNWTKFEHLIYINAGIFIVIGYFLGDQGKQLIEIMSITSLLTIISSIGLITSFSFAGTIWSGVNYMNNRKKEVSIIEDELYQLNAVVQIFSKQGSNGTGIRGVSLTCIILKTVPFILAALWVFFIIILNV